MRTTITIDDELLANAKEFTGIGETSALIKQALTLLVQHQAAERLIMLGGSEPDVKAPPRRRWKPEAYYGEDIE